MTTPMRDEKPVEVTYTEDSMTPYRNAVMRTAGSAHNVVMGALGLAGEAGEVADEVKKIAFHDKTFDRTKMLKELGDVRWYLEYLADCWGFTMKEIEDANVVKLKERYPDGFTVHNRTFR
jgi:NTP pyrophosphatase (non-canonical NTP hydrolase)